MKKFLGAVSELNLRNAASDRWTKYGLNL